MARIRMIKPETFDDPDLCALPVLARWLFVGLWTQADRAGRLEDDPRRLKIRLLPFDRCDVNDLLNLLAPRFITRYVVDGARFIQINHFAKHQRPHPHEPNSVYPEKPIADPKPTNVSTETTNGCTETTIPNHTQPCKVGLVPESGFLILDSGSLDSGSPSSPDGDGFEVFWDAYPRKAGKGAARKVWKTLRPGADLQARILAAIGQQRTCRQWLAEGGKYIPYPTTWLHQGRWDDRPDPDVPQTTPKTSGNLSALAEFQRSRAQ